MLRLRRNTDIEKCLRQGRRCYSPIAALHARRRHSHEPPALLPRLGIIAGRRFRSAVVRNRAKRILREASRLVLTDIYAPWDLVLIARPQALTAPFSERCEVLAHLLQQGDILPQPQQAEPAT